MPPAKSPEALLARLRAEGLTTFRLADLARTTGLDGPATRSLARRLANRGLVERIGPGVYAQPTAFEADRLTLLPPLMGDRPYYLAHATAMQLHGMTTQPAFDICVATTRRKRTLTIAGQRIHFITVAEECLFGLETVPLGSTSIIRSDLERTIVDGLYRPRFSGGVTEVAKAIWVKRFQLDWSKLRAYARRMHSGAVLRRLGFIASTLRVLSPEQLVELRAELGAHYDLLDPTRDTGHARFLDAWRLIVNVSPAELLEAVNR